MAACRTMQIEELSLARRIFEQSIREFSTCLFCYRVSIPMSQADAPPLLQ